MPDVSLAAATECSRLIAGAGATILSALRFATKGVIVKCAYPYQTRNGAQSAIFEYIEVFYNQTRRHTSIGNLSPRDFELQRAKAA